MKIKAFLGGYDKNMSYLIWCESTGIAGIIDASIEITEILKYIDVNNLIIEKVFITHTHFDHIKYLNDLMDQFPYLQICGYKNSEKKIADKKATLRVGFQSIRNGINKSNNIPDQA